LSLCAFLSSGSNILLITPGPTRLGPPEDLRRSCAAHAPGGGALVDVAPGPPARGAGSWHARPRRRRPHLHALATLMAARRLPRARPVRGLSGALAPPRPLPLLPSPVPASAGRAESARATRPGRPGGGGNRGRAAGDARGRESGAAGAEGGARERAGRRGAGRRGAGRPVGAARERIRLGAARGAPLSNPEAALAVQSQHPPVLAASRRPTGAGTHRENAGNPERVGGAPRRRPGTGKKGGRWGEAGGRPDRPGSGGAALSLSGRRGRPGRRLPPPGPGRPRPPGARAHFM